MTTDKKNEREQDDAKHRMFIVLGVLIVPLLLVLVLLVAPGIIPLVFTSMLIAVLLRSLADPVANYLPVSDQVAVIGVLLIFVVGLVLFTIVAAPGLLNQMDELTEKLPETVDSLESNLQEYEWGQTLIDSFEAIPANGNNIDVFSRLSGFFSSAFGTVTNILLALVAGIYVAFEPKLYINNFIRLFSMSRRDQVYDVLSESYDILRYWLLSRVISMTVVGILTFIGLLIIDMPLALTFAVIAAVLSFIPNIGPIMASIPAILVGLTQSLFMGLLVIVVYLIVQGLENYVITPGIQRRTVSLPPALVMLSQVFLAILFGWLGLFIAAPLVAITIVIVKSVYVEGFLGDEVGPILSHR